MKHINLIFKKLGDNWYIDIPHALPEDLILEPKIGKYLSKIDESNNGILNNIWLIEQIIIPNRDNLIQFDEADLSRYFMSDETFMMNLYVGSHKFQISSKLYFLLENYYNLDLHLSSYRLEIYH